MEESEPVIIRKFLLVVAVLSLVPATAPAQGTTRSRRVEQPAAAVRAPRAETATPAPVVPTFERLPFGPGETLTYDIAWNGSTTAAKMVMAVGDRGAYFGAEGIPIRVDVETVGLTRFLAAVDAVYTSYCSPKTVLGHRTEYESTFNGKSQRGSTIFDRKKNVAVSGQSTTPIDPETSDGLSLFYRLRALPLKAGETLTLDGVEGRNRRQIRAIVEARESIASTDGKVNAIRIAFVPLVGGQPDDSNRIRVWYSDDIARVPLLITAEPDVGSIRVTLRSARGTRTK